MSGYVYRPEESKDYANAEALTREAFWNVYQPGCNEHYIMHVLRGHPAVVEELNFVCEDAQGALLGHIFYTRSEVVSKDGAMFPVLTFGPVSVLPEAQKKGIGSTLIRLTLEKAACMRYPGVVITGNPAYYHRFGFRDAARYGILFEDGSSFPELMALELGEHRLDPVHGRLFICREFLEIDQEKFERFDRNFPPKEKLRLPGQLR